MANQFKTTGQLGLEVVLGGHLQLRLLVGHAASLREQTNELDRHRLRAIRSRAMVEVAMAWADPGWRRRWRTGLD